MKTKFHEARRIIPAVLLAVVCTADAATAEVKRVFRGERFLRTDENVRRVQPIDSAAWIWADRPAVWQNPCIGSIFSKGRDILGSTFLRFRKPFRATGEKLRFDVSADERFILLLDGKEIARGPHRGMPERWFYQSYEVSLEPGDHVLEAVVWQIGAHAPLAQLSWRGGFILKAEGAYDALLTTGKAKWTVAELKNTKMTGKGESRAWGVGSESRVVGRSLVHERPDASAYVQAVTVKSPVKNGIVGIRSGGWILFPTVLPDLMHEPRAPGRFKAVRDGASADDAFEESDSGHSMVSGFNSLLSSGKALSIPPNSSFRALWDLGDYYCAYPMLETASGAGAEIRWKWLESLLDARGRKSDRAAFAGKTVGKTFGDVFVSDGSDGFFSSPWWRCGRWCQIEIRTGTEPLLLKKIHIVETRYPMENESFFECDDPSIAEIGRICLRALQMCTHDMTFDCPYYEQHMYPGDSRVQYLVQGALNRDSRLVRQCISLFAEAQRPNGMVPMNFPSRMTQESVTYTMCWIDMFRDYLMWRTDEKWLRAMMPSMRRALDGVAAFETDGLLSGKLPGWSFTDYTVPWRNGLPPYGSKDGMSAIENLQYLYALRSAADTQEALGEIHFARHYREKADVAAKKILERFWCPSRGMLADTTDRDSFSELTQSFGVLTDLFDPARREAVTEGLAQAKDLTPVTPYSSHYLFEAYFALGRADLFFKRLDLWRGYVAANMSTLQESPERPNRDPRSDCHAWGAHPLFHLQANVAGVRPAEPFFRKVRVRPQPGPLKRFRSGTPTPAGPVTQELRFSGDSVNGCVTLPEGMSGTFEWKGSVIELRPGRNTVSVGASAPPLKAPAP